MEVVIAQAAVQFIIFHLQHFITNTFFFAIILQHVLCSEISLPRHIIGTASLIMVSGYGFKFFHHRNSMLQLVFCLILL